MRNAKMFLCAASVMAVMACAMLTTSGPNTADAQQKVGMANHWRYHAGHWNYWHDGDHRWYYTDGSKWYYNNGADSTWLDYGFDKQFGKDGFEKGDYKRASGTGAKVETPRHAPYQSPEK
jgi:hypothetical protein